MTNTNQKADPNGKRAVVIYQTRNGAKVVLNMTAFEKGHLLTRANLLRSRYETTMLPDFRRTWEQFEDRMVATYGVPDALWCCC